MHHLALASQPPRLLSATSAWVEHIPFAMALIDWLRPGALVELGVHAGDSYCAFCQAITALNLPTQCTGIDTWQGDPQAGSYGPEILRNLRAHHDPLYSHFSRLLQVRFNVAATAFQNASIDLLHIDGLHTYAAAKCDVDAWLPKLSPKGLLLLHDTQVRERYFGVHQLWQELSPHFTSFEFLHGNGLGVLAMPEALTSSPALAEFFAHARRSPEEVRDTFSSLGRKITALRDTRPQAESCAPFSCAIESPTSLDPLPPRAASGIVVEGFAFHRNADLESLTLLLSQDNGPWQKIPITEFRTVRHDILARYASHNGSTGERRRVLRSGFWTVLPISGSAAPQQLSLRLCASLTDGNSFCSPTHTLSIAPAPGNPHAGKSLTAPFSAHPQICICLATFNPEPSAFRRQIDSLRGQRYDRWTCIVHDDNSSNLDQIRQILADDPRFTLIASGETRGFYKNFQRALAHVPPHCDFVSLADQDDRWRPEKLATLLAGFSTPDSTLVYSDMRIVDDAGNLLSNTFWTSRTNNSTDLESLFFANTVTGAACMFKAALLSDILPFPPQIGITYHDWWIALCALAVGRIHYIPFPLQDYSQHASNATGWNPLIARPIDPKQLRNRDYRRELLFAARSLYAFRCKFLAQCAVILRDRFPNSTRRPALIRLARIAREPILALIDQTLRSRYHRRASYPQERNILLAFLLARADRIWPSRKSTAGSSQATEPRRIS